MLDPRECSKPYWESRLMSPTAFVFIVASGLEIVIPIESEVAAYFLKITRILFHHAQRQNEKNTKADKHGYD